MAGHAKDPEERRRKLEAARGPTVSSQGPGNGSPPAPAFERGNTAAVTHGAYAAAITDPRAEQKLQSWLTDPDFPEYAKRPAHRFQLRSLALVEVRLELYYEMLLSMTPEEALTEVTETRETVRGGGEQGGPMKRRARMTKRRDPSEEVRRWETLALNIRREMGLTPMAQTKMGRSVAATSVDLAQLIQQATAEDAAALADEGEIGRGHAKG